MSASVLNPASAAGPLPIHEDREEWSSSTATLTTSARAPNDAAGSIPRLVFDPSNNPPRRGDIILSVLRPKAWIPIAIMLAIAGLTVAIVRAFSGANHTKKDL